MKKTDKDGVLTKEYIDYVKGLEREDLEHFYIGADLLVDRLNNIINKAIEYLERKQKETEWWDTDFMMTISILKGDSND